MCVFYVDGPVLEPPTFRSCMMTFTKIYNIYLRLYQMSYRGLTSTQTTNLGIYIKKINRRKSCEFLLSLIYHAPYVIAIKYSGCTSSAALS